MSRIIRLGIAAGLAAAASAAWATDGKSDQKAAGGDVWYDEFYSAGAATPRPVIVPAMSREAPSASAPSQHPRKRASRGDQVRARGGHHRLARSR